MNYTTIIHIYDPYLSQYIRHVVATSEDKTENVFNNNTKYVMQTKQILNWKDNNPLWQNDCTLLR